MHCIGFLSDFSQEIKKNLQVSNYTIVSFLDEFFDIELNQFKNLILLLPYSDDILWDSKKKAWNRMRDDALKDTIGSCISIFVVEPDLHNANYLANIVNNIDKNNQVDNVWVYPFRQELYTRRNNSIEKLAYKK